ncbi:MAG: transposase, partial [Phycisphaerae bacterium]|nr:transposase [Phycisphaerae bacterium]
MCDSNCTPCLPELAHFDVTPNYRHSGRLLNENLVLRKINECQAEKITELKNEIGNLKKLIAALSKNSSTSSKPPSSDIIKGQEKKKGQKDGSKKKGAQKGHKKHKRKSFSPDEIDNWYFYTLNGCPECGSQLELCPEKTKVIQQVEIKEVPVEISEHRGFAYWCEKCQKFHYSDIPDDIKKAGLCGPSFTALTGYMKSAMHCSFSTIRKYIRDVMKIKISRGQLSRLLDKVSRALEAPYEELLKRIPLESKLNIDETGHKENGDRFWTWCFRAELYVLFKIDKSRGSKVLIE